MELNRIHNCTAIDLFASLDEKVALIVADPPYGISYKSGVKIRKPPIRQDNRNVGSTRVSPQTFEGDTVIDISWIPCAFDSLKEGGAMYLFTRWDVLHHWYIAAQSAGFRVAQCITWDKCHWGAGNLKYYGPQTENILFCIKGNHDLRWDKRGGNLFRSATSTMLTLDGGGRHPTQKPVALFKRIIANSSDTNDLIVDPFTGSGAACIAAQKLHRRFVGCDISPTFAEAAQAWVQKESPHTVPMFGGDQ
jgi:DNA modification methylase